MNWDWWLTDPTPLNILLIFVFLAAFFSGWALFGVIPGFAFAGVGVFMLARASARRM